MNDIYARNDREKAPHTNDVAGLMIASCAAGEAGYGDYWRSAEWRDLTVFLYQRMGDYCIGMISSKW
jgi:hypothetical protein